MKRGRNGNPGRMETFLTRTQKSGKSFFAFIFFFFLHVLVINFPQCSNLFRVATCQMFRKHTGLPVSVKNGSGLSCHDFWYFVQSYHLSDVHQRHRVAIVSLKRIRVIMTSFLVICSEFPLVMCQVFLVIDIRVAIKNLLITENGVATFNYS